MAVEDDGAPGGEELVPRAPEERDLVVICRRLNELGARYVVIGGFAVIYGFYPRSTADIDLLIDASLENEALVYQALEVLPDRAVRELKPGEVSEYTVVRVADEVVVDLMKAACGYHGTNFCTLFSCALMACQRVSRLIKTSVKTVFSISRLCSSLVMTMPLTMPMSP